HHRRVVVRIALDDFDRRKQDQMTCIGTPARDDEDAPLCGRKRRGQMAADEAAAAEHDDARQHGHQSTCVINAIAPRGVIIPSRVDSGTYGRFSACAYNIVLASTFLT